jgi:hypothetical protein
MQNSFLGVDNGEVCVGSETFLGHFGNLLIMLDTFPTRFFVTADDKLDFTVQTQFMRDKSVMAKIVRPITWVFSKLLLEFKLTGSSDKPEWKYVSVIDRVVDAVTTDKEGDRK